MFARVFARDSIDDAGMPLEATVHYGDRYDNAFWDGERMVFGDGDGEVFRGFTQSISVIGHELAHGVTERTARLRYQGQSGALNEHVSDVFGALVEQYSMGQDAESATWLIGEGVFTDAVEGRAIRSMIEPGTAYDDDILGKDPQPDHFDRYIDTDEDNGGVHLNSGIPNRAFALAARRARRVRMGARGPGLVRRAHVGSPAARHRLPDVRERDAARGERAVRARLARVARDRRRLERRRASTRSHPPDPLRPCRPARGGSSIAAWTSSCRAAAAWRACGSPGRCASTSSPTPTTGTC